MNEDQIQELNQMLRFNAYSILDAVGIPSDQIQAVYNYCLNEKKSALMVEQDSLSARIKEVEGKMKS